jgi:hypothetical protein
MFSALRKRLHITPATAIALTALVFAVTGVSFAATGGGSGNGGGRGTNNHSLTATAAKSKGKTGPRGPKGPAGPAGKNGTNGTPGAQGPAGPAGAAGAAGGSGESVSSTELKKGEDGCKEGGTKFIVGGKETKACNGKEGKEGVSIPGEPGEPGVIHGAEPLPKGATETGAFTGQPSEAPESHEYIPISFPIRLPAPITSTGGIHTLYVTAEEWEDKSGKKDPAGCEGEPNPVKEPGVKVPGTAEDPQAAEGFLCVYQGFTENHGAGTFGVHIFNPNLPITSGEASAVAGATVLVAYEGPEEPVGGHRLSGTWAVTAAS